MKKSAALVIAIMLGCTSLFSQNITNTLGSTGVFSVKDVSTTFMSISQSSGVVSLSNTLSLPISTGSTLGVIFKNGISFMHDFKATTSIGENTFLGLLAGNFSMGGTTAQEASQNTAVGYSALTALTTGHGHSAFGHSALSSNTTGSNNSAFGKNALAANTEGSHNSAFGESALVLNTTGGDNSALGHGALLLNVDATGNSAFGYFAAASTTGNFNSALGYQSLFTNSSGTYNTAVGYRAGYSTSGSNNIAIGNDAQVAVGSDDNQIRIGNTSITLATTQVAWTTTSDRRWKSNITESNLGLEFVSKLNPVVYTRNNDDKQRLEYGFIAQELETVLEEAGVENAGMLTVDSEGMYQLRYNDLLAPMVKAIQELSNEKDKLKSENEALRFRLVKLEDLVDSKLAQLEHE